ncbi:hypothetical protein BDN67DRAFT_592676 [Paxillus ammoniavirescens]|nr:hypothetical protein BDN67DRAFT_592676 [Paxillus ammoniavirescens]
MSTVSLARTKSSLDGQIVEQRALFRVPMMTMCCDIPRRKAQDRRSAQQSPRYRSDTLISLVWEAFRRSVTAPRTANLSTQAIPFPTSKKLLKIPPHVDTRQLGSANSGSAQEKVEVRELFDWVSKILKLRDSRVDGHGHALSGPASFINEVIDTRYTSLTYPSENGRARNTIGREELDHDGASTRMAEGGTVGERRGA